MKKILNFIGNSCTGKTTISNMIFENHPSCFFLAYDKIKWQFSGYNRDKHRGLIGEIEQGFLYALMRQKEISFIISDFIFQNEEDFEKLREQINISKENVINIYLEAPLEIRLQRWKKRTQEAIKKGKKISITTEELFLDQAQKPFYCPKNSLRFDTSIHSKDAIVNTITKLL